MIRVDDAQAMLVITKTKLDGSWFIRIWAFEVGIGAQ